MDEPEMAAARPLFERAAEAGHRGAMYHLGMVWAHFMEPPDLDAARHWYERAAAAGHGGAMTALGNLYAQVMQPPDLAAARRWYQRASASGDRGAMHNLEVLFEDSEMPAGWGARPPSDEEMDAMVEWLDGPGAGVEDAFVASDSALDEIINAFKRGDGAAVRAACNKITRVLTHELPAALPTPDPDLTRALQALIDDGNELSWADRELAGPLTPQQRETMQSRCGDLASSLHTLASIYERDGDILESADRG
jgi:TPR repeat protein